MNKRRKNSESLVERTAKALIDISIARDPGDYLGAESEMMELLKVSRPTLRQAVKIAEYDRLITVRPGHQGGYYVTRPDVTHAIRSLVQYLRHNGTSLEDIVTATMPSLAEAAAKAAHSDDAVLREELQQFIAGIDPDAPPLSIMHMDMALADLIAAMTGNLAVDIVKALGSSFGTATLGENLFQHPGRRQQVSSLHRGIAQAILDRDPDIARLLANRLYTSMLEWVAKEEK